MFILVEKPTLVLTLINILKITHCGLMVGTVKVKNQIWISCYSEREKILELDFPCNKTSFESDSDDRQSNIAFSPKAMEINYILVQGQKSLKKEGNIGRKCFAQ